VGGDRLAKPDSDVEKSDRMTSSGCRTLDITLTSESGQIKMREREKKY
jgi:hypothetical protein